MHTFLWSDGSTNEDLTGLFAGIYSVTATDENGCTSSEIVAVSEADALISSIILSDYNGYGVSCNGDTDGSIDLTVNGGVDNQAYSYSWSNGQATEDISGLGFGSYIVTVTDVNGCLLSDSTNISQPDVLVGGLLSTSQTICANEILDTILTNIPMSGGNPPYTYCLLYTSPSPRDGLLSRMPSSA